MERGTDRGVGSELPLAAANIEWVAPDLPKCDLRAD